MITRENVINTNSLALVIYPHGCPTIHVTKGTKEVFILLREVVVEVVTLQPKQRAAKNSLHFLMHIGIEIRVFFLPASECIVSAKADVAKSEQNPTETVRSQPIPDAAKIVIKPLPRPPTEPKILLLP